MSERRPIVAANWKMHKTHLEAIQAVQKLSYLLDVKDAERVEVVICPPFTSLRSIETLIQSDRLPYGLGAQNVHWEERGAFTGEVSPEMLQALRVSYVIVGHSERRELFGETDAALARKVPAALAAGLLPILCVGETEDEREAGETQRKLRQQVQVDLAAVDAARLAEVVIAYEPIWAIGTGKTATPEQAQDAIAFVRALVRDRDADVATRVRILYGGSVKASNAAELLSLPDVDGALVGGASLDPGEFAAIVAAAPS
jgi:triosephosphate isomerase